MGKFLGIAFLIGSIYFGYHLITTNKNGAVNNQQENNIFANVDFDKLLPSPRSDDGGAKTLEKSSNGQQPPSIPAATNHQQTIKPNPSPVVKNSSPDIKYARIDIRNIGQIIAPEETAGLLGQMLLSCQNPIKLLDLKSQIEAIFAKPEKGDVKLARSLNQQGLTAFSQESYSEAARLFLNAAQANPSDIEALNNYAYALLKNNNNQLSQKVLGYVLSLAPGRTSAWANLAEVYANLNQIDPSAAALVVAFQFSGNKEKTLNFFNQTKDTTNSEALKTAILKALAQLSDS